MTDDFDDEDGRKGGPQPFIDQREYLCTLLDDPRILGIASSLLGDDFNYMGSDGNYYVGDTPWHSDGWHPEMRHIKIAFYLDPVTRDTGCLRVIPGSHRVGDRYAESLQEQLRRSEERLGVQGASLPAVALETQPGDVLCFNHNTKHCAFGGHAHDVAQRVGMPLEHAHRLGVADHLLAAVGRDRHQRPIRRLAQ